MTATAPRSRLAGESRERPATRSGGALRPPGRVRRIRPGDCEYPAALTEISGFPQQLFVTGKSLGNALAVAVVGTRRASRYGIEVAELLGRELAEAGITVVSGLAWGIDAAAHRGALASGGATVAVLGNGLDVCFPKRNRWLYERIAAEGTLISEYEAGTPALRHNFPLRNRIIAGISCAAVIVEATAKGGAMITARLAMEYGRDVFAMPGPVHSPASAGCHALVRDGARLVTCARDVLEDLGWLCLASEKQSPHLDPDESRVLGVLEAQGILLETLARRCRMPISTVSAVMTRLEIRGLATHCPGGRFALAVT